MWSKINLTHVKSLYFEDSPVFCTLSQIQLFKKTDLFKKRFSNKFLLRHSFKHSTLKLTWTEFRELYTCSHCCIHTNDDLNPISQYEWLKSSCTYLKIIFSMHRILGPPAYTNIQHVFTQMDVPLSCDLLHFTRSPITHRWCLSYSRPVSFSSPHKHRTTRNNTWPYKQDSWGPRIWPWLCKHVFQVQLYLVQYSSMRTH